MKQIILLQLLIFISFPLWSQERPLNTGLTNDEQYALVGLMLSDIIERYGPPRAVTAARGIDLWQDDVVFHYTGVDFYIFRDRVWQVRFNTTHGISIGESKSVVMLKLGNIPSAEQEIVNADSENDDSSLTTSAGRISVNSENNNSSVQDMGDYLLLPISGKTWPLMLRINFNNTGHVNAIFLYNPEF